MDSDDIKVLLSILLIWAMVIATCVFAARQDKRAPADDIGIMWLVVLAMYGTLPPLSWLLQGSTYGIFSFQRLLYLQPTSDEIVQLMYIGTAYACGFAGVYLYLRRSVPKPLASGHALIKGPQITAALLFVLFYLTLTTALRAGGYLREAESYSDSYSAVSELPLALRQVLKIAGGFAAVAQMIVLVAILQRWPRTRWFFILYLSTFVLSYDPGGSRKAIAMGLLSAAIAWHVLVRPITASRWIAAGGLGFMTFTILGVLRGMGIWGGDGGGDIQAGDFEGLGLGELDALWANALHLLQEGKTKLDIPWAARYGEFWAFIPSQMLPFDKLALNDWYLDTFFPEYKEQGGGWEFGALTQAVIGGGAVEAALRGGVVAVLSIRLLTWYRSPTATWWRLPLYMYLLTLAFLSIRDTTFRPLAEFVQLGIPALILIQLIAELMAQVTPSARATNPKLSHTPNA